MVASELVLGAIALGFLQARRYAISSLFPAPTLQGCAVGIGLFFATWVVGWLLTAPFVGRLPEQPIDRMVHDANLSLPVIVLMAMVNGTYEEIFLLGFLLRGLRGFGLSVALGVMLLVRVLYHLYQGPVGALWVLAFGLVLGLYFIRSGRLWPAIFAHVLGDIVPLVFRDP